MIRKLGSFLAVALLAAACGGAQDGGGDGDGDGTGSEVAVVVDCSTVAAAVTVTTPGFRFEPKTANIQVGDVVRFDPSSGHDVVSDGGAFEVGLGGSACFRFEQPGSFGYRCSPHDFTGTIVVQ